MEKGTGNRGITRVRERRRFPRLADRFDVRFKVIDERTSAQPYAGGLTCDIGRGGLRFITTRAPSVGDCLAIHLSIPGRNRVIAALTEVLRVERVSSDADPWTGAGPAPGDESARAEVGVRFLWSGWHDGAMQREIADFVNDELASRDAPDGG